MNQIMKFSTSACFSSDLDSPPDEDDIESEDDEWPPFRKVEKFLKLKFVDVNLNLLNRLECSIPILMIHD